LNVINYIFSCRSNCNCCDRKPERHVRKASHPGSKQQ